MKRYFVEITMAVLVIGLLFGCASKISTLKLSPEEQTYLGSALSFPLEFIISNNEADVAWGRTQSFIGKFSSMKLQMVTDYVIQTYNPRSGDTDFGYYVTKTPLGDKVQITVQCNTGNQFRLEDAKNNAHIFAYYIKTGALSPRLIVR